MTRPTTTVLLHLLLAAVGLAVIVAPLAIVGLRELARVRKRAQQRREVLVMTVVEPARLAPAAIESGKRPAKELTR